MSSESDSSDSDDSSEDNVSVDGDGSEKKRPAVATISKKESDSNSLTERECNALLLELSQYEASKREKTRSPSCDRPLATDNKEVGGRKSRHSDTQPERNGSRSSQHDKDNDNHTVGESSDLLNSLKKLIGLDPTTDSSATVATSSAAVEPFPAASTSRPRFSPDTAGTDNVDSDTSRLVVAHDSAPLRRGKLGANFESSIPVSDDGIINRFELPWEAGHCYSPLPITLPEYVHRVSTRRAKYYSLREASFGSRYQVPGRTVPYFSARGQTAQGQAFYNDWNPQLMRRIQEKFSFQLSDIEWLQRILLAAQVPLRRPCGLLHFDQTVQDQVEVAVVLELVDQILMPSSSLTRPVFKRLWYDEPAYPRDTMPPRRVFRRYRYLDTPPPSPPPPDLPSVPSQQQQEAALDPPRVFNGPVFKSTLEVVKSTTDPGEATARLCPGRRILLPDADDDDLVVDNAPCLHENLVVNDLSTAERRREEIGIMVDKVLESGESGSKNPVVQLLSKIDNCREMMIDLALKQPETLGSLVELIKLPGLKSDKGNLLNLVKLLARRKRRKSSSDSSSSSSSTSDSEEETSRKRAKTNANARGLPPGFSASLPPPALQGNVKALGVLSSMIPPPLPPVLAPTTTGPVVPTALLATTNGRKPLFADKSDHGRKPLLSEEIDPGRKPLLEEKVDPGRKPLLDEKSDPGRKPLLAEEIDPDRKPLLEEKVDPGRKPLLEEKSDPGRKPLLAEEIDPGRKPLLAEEIDPASRKPLLADESHHGRKLMFASEIDPGQKPLLTGESDPGRKPMLEVESDPGRKPLLAEKIESGQKRLLAQESGPASRKPLPAVESDPGRTPLLAQLIDLAFRKSLLAEESDPGRKSLLEDKNDPGRKPLLAEEIDPGRRPLLEVESGSGQKPLLAQLIDLASRKPLLAQESDPGRKSLLEVKNDPGRKPLLAQEIDPGRKPLPAGESDPGQKPLLTGESDPGRKPLPANDNDPGRMPHVAVESDPGQKPHLADESGSSQKKLPADKSDPGTAPLLADKSDPGEQPGVAEESDAITVKSSKDRFLDYFFKYAVKNLDKGEDLFASFCSAFAALLPQFNWEFSPIGNSKRMEVRLQFSPTEKISAQGNGLRSAFVAALRDMYGDALVTEGFSEAPELCQLLFETVHINQLNFEMEYKIVAVFKAINSFVLHGFVEPPNSGNEITEKIATYASTSKHFHFHREYVNLCGKFGYSTALKFKFSGRVVKAMGRASSAMDSLVRAMASAFGFGLMRQFAKPAWKFVSTDLKEGLTVLDPEEQYLPTAGTQQFAKLYFMTALCLHETAGSWPYQRSVNKMLDASLSQAAMYIRSFKCYKPMLLHMAKLEGLDGLRCQIEQGRPNYIASLTLRGFFGVVERFLSTAERVDRRKNPEFVKSFANAIQSVLFTRALHGEPTGNTFHMLVRDSSHEDLANCVFRMVHEQVQYRFVRMFNSLTGKSTSPDYKFIVPAYLPDRRSGGSGSRNTGSPATVVNKPPASQDASWKGADASLKGADASWKGSNASLKGPGDSSAVPGPNSFGHVEPHKRTGRGDQDHSPAKMRPVQTTRQSSNPPTECILRQDNSPSGPPFIPSNRVDETRALSMSPGSRQSSVSTSKKTMTGRDSSPGDDSRTYEEQLTEPTSTQDETVSSTTQPEDTEHSSLHTTHKVAVEIEPTFLRLPDSYIEKKLVKRVKEYVASVVKKSDEKHGFFDILLDIPLAKVLAVRALDGNERLMNECFQDGCCSNERTKQLIEQMKESEDYPSDANGLRAKVSDMLFHAELSDPKGPLFDLLVKYPRESLALVVLYFCFVNAETGFKTVAAVSESLSGSHRPEEVRLAYSLMHSVKEFDIPEFRDSSGPVNSEVSEMKKSLLNFASRHPTHPVGVWLCGYVDPGASLDVAVAQEPSVLRGMFDLTQETDVAKDDPRVSDISFKLSGVVEPGEKRPLTPEQGAQRGSGCESPSAADVARLVDETFALVAKIAPGENALVTLLQMQSSARDIVTEIAVSDRSFLREMMEMITRPVLREDDLGFLQVLIRFKQCLSKETTEVASNPVGERRQQAEDTTGKRFGRDHPVGFEPTPSRAASSASALNHSATQADNREAEKSGTFGGGESEKSEALTRIGDGKSDKSDLTFSDKSDAPRPVPPPEGFTWSDSEQRKCSKPLEFGRKIPPIDAGPSTTAEPPPKPKTSKLAQKMKQIEKVTNMICEQQKSNPVIQIIAKRGEPKQILLDVAMNKSDVLHAIVKLIRKTKPGMNVMDSVESEVEALLSSATRGASE